jgi:hypothetical protein
LRITSGSFTQFFSRYKQIPQAAKENPLVMCKRLRKPASDARMAKGKLRKQITSSFSEFSANYVVFTAMYIKILSSNIKITNAKMQKLKKTISPRREYRYDIVDHKKALKIW